MGSHIDVSCTSSRIFSTHLFAFFRYSICNSLACNDLCYRPVSLLEVLSQVYKYKMLACTPSSPFPSLRRPSFSPSCGLVTSSSEYIPQNIPASISRNSVSHPASSNPSAGLSGSSLLLSDIGLRPFMFLHEGLDPSHIPGSGSNHSHQR